MIDRFTELRKFAQENGHVLYDIFFGPNHPGMNGNFGYVLDMVGSQVVDVRLNAGQLHRGFEKLMERRLWLQNFSLIPRVCVVDPDPNEVAYATAAEKIGGIEIPKRAKYLRTIVLEMSRMSSLLMGMGSVGGATGLYTIMHWMMADRDYLLDMFEWLTGGRVYHIFNIIGGVRRNFPEGWTDKILELMDYYDNELKEYDHLLYNNPIIVKRLEGLAPITGDEAKKWGITGPNLRASGVKSDIRIDYPYAAYDEVEVNVPIQENAAGDALARAIQVRLEFEESINIVRRAIKQLPDGPVNVKLGNPLKLRIPKGEAYSKVESSKGEFGYYIISDGGIRPYRVSVRGPSLPAGLFLCKRDLPKIRIEDVALWMNTYGICAPDFDR